MVKTTTRKLSRKQALSVLVISILLLGICWLRVAPMPVPLIMLATVLANGGKAIVTNRIKGSGTEPNYVAVGTGAGTAAATDTSLFTEVETRVAGTSTQQTTTTTSDTYRVVGTVSITATRTLTNAGLFDASSSGNMLMKGDFANIGLVNGDSITIAAAVVFS